MIFNFSLPVVAPSVIVFPDWSFPDVPVDPQDIKETISLGGSSTGGSISITGSVDSPES